jgi:hypothetical protein
MPRPRRATLAAILTSGLLLSVLVVSPVAAHDRSHHHGPSVSVIASGLDNPRGIAISSNGTVLVAEAGSGGDAPGGFGLTGRVISISHGDVHTVINQLPSAVSPEGEVTGPTNVASTWGRVSVTIGGGPQVIDPRFDTLLGTRPHGVRIVADIQAYRNAHQDETDLDVPLNRTDSNAYGLDTTWSGTLVTDAAGNELDLVNWWGRTVTVAKFPNEVMDTGHIPGFPGPPALPGESVPTTVAVGPDGYWYVGELKGFPFAPGASKVWRIAPWARNVVCDPAATSGPCTVFAGGFTSITGLDFGPDGSLYVVEIVKNSVLGLFDGSDTTGALWRVKHGVRTELIPGQLTAPGDVAVARDGTIYVTNKSVLIGGGEVIRIRP